MTYHITQLMDDARLRRGLLELNITVEDLTGEFSCLDLSQSLLKNHRAVFDRLSELGGEELLGRLLESGSPCMTDDPKSAKQGVRPIKGTEKYFLKTNAGGPTVLASILGAIAFWMEDQGRDPDQAILFHTEEEVCGEEGDEESGDSSDFLHSSDGLFEVLPPRRCSLIQKNGKYAFFDEDEKSFLSFDCRDANGEHSSISEFAVCQLMDEERPEMGWKYKLTDDDDALWGWISACGNHHLDPQFKEFFAASVEINIPHSWDSIPIISIGCSHRREMVNNFATICGICNTTLSRSVFFLCREDDSAPWRMEYIEDLSWHEDLSKFDSLRIESEDVENILYCIDDQWGRCYIDEEEYHCKKEGPVLLMSIRRQDDTPLYRWPASLTLDGVRDALENGKQYAEGLVYLVEDHYALRRDGWWAVAEIATWPVRGLKLLTPFAFTGVPQHMKEASSGLFEGSFVMVDRFGKKGVFDCEKGTYPVPCDYEEIEVVEDEFTKAFTVRRMGYEGLIDYNGKWVWHLHRKED